MKRIFRLRLITDTTVEQTKETFHLVFAVAPAFGAIISTLIGRELLDLFIEVGLVSVVVFINFALLLLSARAAKKTKELSPFFTFWWNKLLPNRSGDRQEYDVRVAVIEERSEHRFSSALKRKFKREFGVEKLKALLSQEHRLKNPILKEQKLDELIVNVSDADLFFKPVFPPKGGESNDETIVADSKRYLDNKLDKSTAVVLVRTQETDKTPSLYKALSNWGYEHSERPILFAQDENKKFSEDDDAKSFLWIPDDPKGLPWSLLQRALTRAKAWRTQATYNRSMVWNIFYISLLCTYIGVIWAKQTSKALATVRAQQQQQKIQSDQDRQRETTTEKANRDLVTEAYDEALFTERSLRPQISLPADLTFAVSYWYRIDGQPNILVTTEIPRTTQFLKSDTDTVIGCTFENRNVLVEGSVKSGENDQMTVVGYSDYKQVAVDCRVGKFEHVPIKNITCVSRDDSSDRSRTVGICAFTQNEKNSIFKEKVRDLLWTRVKDFHTRFINRIQNRKELSLAVREPKPSPSPALR